MSIGADILEALKARLEGIQASAGYSVSVKRVHLDDTEPVLATAAMDLPLIEIFDSDEDYEHGASAGYHANTHVFLNLVAEKSWTDRQMQDFMSDVRKALFGGFAAASGNTGVTLGGKVESIRLVSSASDMNMIESNRIYIMRIMLRSYRTTYKS